MYKFLITTLLLLSACTTAQTPVPVPRVITPLEKAALMSDAMCLVGQTRIGLRFDCITKDGKLHTLFEQGEI